MTPATRNAGIRRRVLLVLLALAVICLLPLAAQSGWRYWFEHRSQPLPEHRQLFNGIDYTRIVRTLPVPLVAHIVRIDLQAEGIGFLVTPGDTAGGGEVRARTTSDFLAAQGAQLAINGSFFTPFHSNGPLDYYPHTGDTADIDGLAISRGQTYSAPDPRNATMFLTADNRVFLGAPGGNPFNALSGTRLLVENGRVVCETDAVRHPRTAVALDRAARMLLLAVVDGRQPNYSEGATLRELAELLVANGAHTVLNLDGGGSSVLVIEGEDGQPCQLSTPLTFRTWVGHERPVANHLGVFAMPLRQHALPPSQ